MSNEIDARLLQAVQNSFEMYKEHGPRSNEKLKVLHGWVIEELRGLLDDSYKISGMSDSSNKEQYVKGRYYDKKVDVCIEKDGSIIGVVSIKFVVSNYRQNVNNYLEQQMGETANLRRNNIVFGHLLCFRVPIPYYKKSKDYKENQEIKKYEAINDRDIKKYAQLAEDHEHTHAPDVQAVATFFWDEKTDAITKKCGREELSQLSDESYAYLQKKLNVTGFFEVLASKIKDKALEQSRTK